MEGAEDYGSSMLGAVADTSSCYRPPALLMVVRERWGSMWVTANKTSSKLS